MRRNRLGRSAFDDRTGHDGTVAAGGEDTGDVGTVRTGTAGISAVRRAGLTTWDWATLLKRVWGFDAPACTGCGGRMRFIAVIKDRAVVEGAVPIEGR